MTGFFASNINFNTLMASPNTMWMNCVALCLILTAAHEAGSAVVKTTHGPIEGDEVTLYNGKKVDAFRGIPYAARPTGQNRFAPPQPLTPWNEVLQTRKLPQICVQSASDEMRKTDWFVLDYPESEDCLYLNVWRPQGVTEKMTVMIWIPGGGFVAGSSTMPMYNGQYLASAHNVIVASMNYRLGIFGFLYLNNTDVPGNAGLQDQIQAIKWIKANVEAFGGDPDKITLFGESAGAVSVTSHIMNKDVRPLIRNAILQSGPITTSVITMPMYEALRRSNELAEEVGCPIENKEEMLACLRKKEPQDLVKTIKGLFVRSLITYCPMRNGIEVPVDVFAGVQGVPESERMNVLGGNVPREFTFLVTDLFPKHYLTDDLVLSLEDMKEMQRNAFKLFDERLQSVLMHEYTSFDGSFNIKQLRNESLSALSDADLLCLYIDFSKQWVTATNKVFYFYFNHRPSKPLRFTIPEWAGTLHGDDIPFAFGIPTDPNNGYSQEDKQVSEQFMAYFANFAKTGDPNGEKPGKSVWPTVSGTGPLNYMEIHKGATPKSGLREKECDFWKNIYPGLLSIQKQLDQETIRT